MGAGEQFSWELPPNSQGDKKEDGNGASSWQGAHTWA